MMRKAEAALMRAYLKAKLAVLKFQQEEDGLETVETVILVGVAVILAVIVFNVLTGGDTQNGQGGIIGDVFQSIRDKIKEIFG